MCDQSLLWLATVRRCLAPPTLDRPPCVPLHVPPECLVAANEPYLGHASLDAPMMPLAMYPICRVLGSWPGPPTTCMHAHAPQARRSFIPDTRSPPCPPTGKRLPHDCDVAGTLRGMRTLPCQPCHARRQARQQMARGKVNERTNLNQWV